MSDESERKSQSEIVEEIRADKSMFMFRGDALCSLLDAEHLAPLVKEVPDDWKQRTPEECIADYLPFALGKAQGHRGISATRSVEKMRAWAWAAGVELTDNYAQYGVPVLVDVAEKFGISDPLLESEDIKRMARGESCQADCHDGCGQ